MNLAIENGDLRERGSGAGWFVYLSILALGTLLWWLGRAHAAAMPPWAPYDFDWTYFLATALAVFWYGRGFMRQPTQERPRPWRVVLFGLGVGTIYAVLQTRFEYMAEHMFFLNRVQHVIMHHLGPFLVALAWPGATIARGMPDRLRRIASSRPVSLVLTVLQQPVVAAILFVGLIGLWLLPEVHFVAMIDPQLYRIMNWSMVVDGLLFWFLVLDPRPSPPAFASHGGRIATSVLVMFPQIAIGAMIAFAHHDIYGFYDWCGRLFPSIGALDDQAYGGLIVWIPAAMMSVLGTLCALNMLRLNEYAKPEEIEDEDDGTLVISADWTGL